MSHPAPEPPTRAGAGQIHPTTPMTHTYDAHITNNHTNAPENGEFIIVLDDQDRENEGDLIIAADSITPAQMAFLVRHTR